MTLNRSVKFRLLVVAALFGILILSRLGVRFGETTFPALGSLRPITRVQTNEPKVALTFELSYGEDVPPAILTELKNKKTQATFFVTGAWAGTNPRTLARMVDDGHDIGSLGYSYVNLTNTAPAEVEKNLALSADIFKHHLGKLPDYFRPPNGRYNQTLLRRITEAGYLPVLWSLDSVDTGPGDAAYITKRLLDRVQPGDIILFHADDTATKTLEALPEILEGLKEKGLQPVPLSNLLEGDQD